MNTSIAPLPEIWMILKDRKQLAKIMAIQGCSARQLARAAGWKSHSYMNRLISGQAKNLEVEPAVRIAKYLGLGVDDLFLAKVSSETGKTAKSGRAA